MIGVEPIDDAKVKAFAGKMVGDLAGAMATLLGVFGDRLGLFRGLADGGPATSDELAQRTSVDERWVREWLRGLAAAGYLDHDRGSGRFALAREHAEVLAREDGPFFAAGAYQALFGELQLLDRLIDAFRSGRGVPQSAYPADTWEGLCRLSRAWFDNLLVPQWIAAAPEVEEKLTHGARYADIGCGAGVALIRLAEAYPRSHFVGYDNFEPPLERARAAARAAGVADRVRFVRRDVTEGLPDTFDVISAFDVVHDAADPVGLLRSIRHGLAADGTHLLLEMNAANDPADNVGPIATLYYGVSILYCTPTSLASGGEGLGTLGMPPAKVRELSERAGFALVRQLPIESPFHILYEVSP